MSKPERPRVIHASVVSRVSFFMNKFRKLGFISYNGKIEVNSSLLNAVLYDKPEIKREP
jgi:CRP/FNR family transcriptional regulator, cyclic AMP receptor protein